MTEFDPKKNAQEIKELEADVQRIEFRMKENEMATRSFENDFNFKRQHYLNEKQKLDELLAVKEKVSK